MGGMRWMLLAVDIGLLASALLCSLGVDPASERGSIPTGSIWNFTMSDSEDPIVLSLLV
jgi:hypothetical protein